MITVYHVASATPTVSSSPAYTSGDQVGTLMTLTGVGEGASGCILEKVAIVDRGKQKSALKIFLFDAAPTIISVDNGAADISDAEMAAKCIGVVNVVAGDYHDMANNSVADTTYLKPVRVAGGVLFALIVAAGTPTYASTTDLVCKFHFSWE